MADLDPYYRATTLEGTEFIQTCRPITLTQNSEDPSEVNLPADKDVVVFGDVVTIRGPIQVRRPPPKSTGGHDWTHPVTKSTQVATGARIVILARRLDTLPAKGGDAKLDVTGALGVTSDRIWSGPPVPAGKARPGAPGEGRAFGWLTPTPGGTGESGYDASGKKNPSSRLHGQPGDPGGPGGAGGAVELRCGSLASTVALGVDVSGGAGGTGLNGQPGAKGGAGGPGDNGGFLRGLSPGGNGGRGGDGGDGGAPGPGGDPGSITIWLRSGSASGITCKLDAGKPGDPGAGGDPGPGGEPGPGGRDRDPYGDAPSYPMPDGQRGADGEKGHTPDGLQQAHPNEPTITAPCDDGALVARLTQPLSAYLAMMLDLMRADYLKATGDSSPDALGDLMDRLDWVNALATAYAPVDPHELDALDAVRGRIQTMHERLKSGLDYFGHPATFAPLGALSSYQDEFNQALGTLRILRSKYETNLKALDAATVRTDQLQQAVDDLTDDRTAYTDGAKAERDAIKDLIARISGHDSDAVGAAKVLVNNATKAFREAVAHACGLTLGDLVDVVGQFAFLGEHQPQQMAMYASQAGKLVETAASKCVTETGVQVDKRLVIDKLGTVEDLTTSLEGYSGTINGIKLSDPAAVKLLGKQADLDQLCIQFWSYPGAAELKDAFDDYVSVVQARNADILALNGSLARLRGYLAGAAQCDASIAEAMDKEGKLAVPGAPALVTELARMVARATDDCIYWLYLVSRAYRMWSLQPDDELAKQLREIGGADALAVTPEVLASAAEGMSTDYMTVFDQQLANAGAWIPHPAHEGVWYPAPRERGLCVEFTHETHRAFIEALRDPDKRSATIAIRAPRLATRVADPKLKPAPEHELSGYADVRVTKVRPWVFGARLESGTAAKRKIRVDLTHTGRETIVSPDDTVTVVTHDEVHLIFEYEADKPNDLSGIQTDAGLFDTANRKPGAMIGPFTRWRVTIPEAYNDQSLDTSGIDKVVFELFLHQRPYPPAKARQVLAAATT